MTYTSPARVITGIIQANLLHLPIKDDHAVPIKSRPARTPTGFSKIEGFEGKRSLHSPTPPPSFHLFALAPQSARPECEKLIRAARVSFPSYGNACYAGYDRFKELLAIGLLGKKDERTTIGNFI